MAIREYECKDHGRFDELVYGDYPKQLPCPTCGDQSKFVFSGANFKFGFWYGWDPGAGKGFDSARQRDNFLSETGLEPAPDGVYGKEGADIS